MEKQLNFKIEGRSPLLLNRFSGDRQTGKNSTPQEQAEECLYHSANGNICIPNPNFHRALISGAARTLVGGKGKKTYKQCLASSVYLLEAELDLGTTQYTIDARGVVIAATKGRVIRFRPRLNEWGAVGTLVFDSEQIPERDLKKVVSDTGLYIGLGDFRPEKLGPYGRFAVSF